MHRYILTDERQKNAFDTAGFRGKEDEALSVGDREGHSFCVIPSNCLLVVAVILACPLAGNSLLRDLRPADREDCLQVFGENNVILGISDEVIHLHVFLEHIIELFGTPSSA